MGNQPPKSRTAAEEGKINCCFFYQQFVICVPAMVTNYLSRGGLVAVPEDVRLHHVEAAVLGLLYQIRPHLQGRRSKHASEGSQRRSTNCGGGPQRARISGGRRNGRRRGAGWAGRGRGTARKCGAPRGRSWGSGWSRRAGSGAGRSPPRPCGRR